MDHLQARLDAIVSSAPRWRCRDRQFCCKTGSAFYARGIGDRYGGESYSARQEARAACALGSTANMA
jgi:hypothetical protein